MKVGENMEKFKPKLSQTYTQILGIYVPKNHIYMKIDNGYIWASLESILFQKDSIKANCLFSDYVNQKTGETCKRNNTVYIRVNSKIWRIMHRFAMQITSNDFKTGYSRNDLYRFMPSNKLITDYKFIPFKGR